MDPFSEDLGFMDLLTSKQESHTLQTHSDAEEGPVGEKKSKERRRKWSHTEDVVLIGAWLNTSKDPIVAVDQKFGSFWSRIAIYYAENPKLVGVEKMASSSKNIEEIMDEYFDHAMDNYFDQAFENRFDHAMNQFAPEKKKRVHIERKREEGHQRLWDDYFREDATYSPKIFRRHFRMNKPLFMRIVERLSTEVPYFEQRRNGHGRLGLSAIQKCIAAIRMMAYGAAGDSFDEYLRLAESTTLLCLEKFTEGIIHLFGYEYLRRPTTEDLQRLLNIGENRGFPGMIGSIDCMHWEWKNCPTAWKGQYTRGSGNPTIVLEAVASQDFWIWHAFFGALGTLNDINILARSPVFDDILHGVAPRVKYIVNGRQYHMAYYLTDGIYPDWATFIQ
ncbi:PREDICTED: uncharacterized protein LOC104773559 [Camelina sativa]|uniref:Uncharacterized protein LOC104773559 n=1 Tax=Camelina sativa TaxID=90675 RepID=A0ABM0Y6Y3_CAMSA|nr:PREDICTED: uncharacterized protein LOC104773559 [Camelina sativa]XP_019098244.1 PREDICTED: uncharacterized protein LOC104773559 [Camelina sativa]